MLSFESESLGRGLQLTDAILNKCELDVLEATLMAPGKFVGLLRGKSAEVKKAEQLWDQLIRPGERLQMGCLHDPDPRLFDAIFGLNAGVIKESLFIAEIASFPKALSIAQEILVKTKTEIVEFRTYRSGFSRCQILFSTPKSQLGDLDEIVKSFADASALSTSIENPSPRFLAFYNPESAP